MRIGGFIINPTDHHEFSGMHCLRKIRSPPDRKFTQSGGLSVYHRNIQKTQKDISSPFGTIFTLRLPSLHSIMPPT